MAGFFLRRAYFIMLLKLDPQEKVLYLGGRLSLRRWRSFFGRIFAFTIDDPLRGTGTRWTIPPEAMPGYQVQGHLRGTALGFAIGATATVRDYPELDGYAGVVQPIPNNQVITAIYTLPPARKHLSGMLAGAVPPPPALNDVDRLPTVRTAGTGHGFGMAHSAQVDNLDPDALESQAFSQVWQPQDPRLTQQIRAIRHAAGFR